MLVDPWTVKVNDQTLTAKNIIIATGARPFVPPIKGIENVDVLTSDTLWELKEQPKNMIVLGGGPIGSEMAQAFGRLGTKVTLVEMGPAILSKEDSDVQELVKKQFEDCLLYTSPSPRDATLSRMPSSA